MSVYYLVLVVLLLLMALVPYNTGQQYIDDDDDEIEVVRSCQSGYVHNVECEQDGRINIIIAATLNGAVTALDGDTGELLWRYQDDPLLRGSLTSSEPIDIGGTSLQLMPTLDGRLFSYTHNTNLIEPMSITTDSLLESTMRLGQDAVAGGKSVTTKGFDLYTGELRYECSMDSCGNQDGELPVNPVLLVKRVTNSIRAMDTMRGVERWNLSTAELDVSLAGGIPVSDIPTTDLKILLRPPDGVLVAVNKHSGEKWKTDVQGHIVSAWQVSGNMIGEISLFDPRNIFTTRTEVMHREQRNLQMQSSLFYMGTSDGFPFIIQSPKAKRNLKKKMNSLPEPSGVAEFTSSRFCSANDDTRSLAYDVKHETLRAVLQQAFQSSQSKAIEDKSPSGRRDLQILTQEADKPAQQLGTENMRSTSLSQSGDHGYLIYDAAPSRAIFKLPSPTTFVQSMFHYLFNPTALLGLFAGFVGVALSTVYWIRKPSQLMLQQRFSTESSDLDSTSQRTRNVSYGPTDDEIGRFIDDGSDSSGTPRRLPAERALVVVEKSNIEKPSSPIFKTPKRQAKTDVDTDESSLSNDEKKRLLRERTISRSSLEGFTSRFANEFEVKKVIGYGGFGIVFHAQNKVDKHEYAVKRIAVVDNEKARDRVFREARALALFDHPGIIRYFYTWEERPPKGYQDKEDEGFFGKLKAEKLAKLHEIKQKKKRVSNLHNMRSADTASFAETFEMPPVVGHTCDAEDSWNVSDKPMEIGAKRTTSESKQGLHGESDSSTTELHKAKSTDFSDIGDESDTSEESSSSSSSSSSGSSISDRPHVQNSSTGGIVFGDGSDVVDNEEIKEAEEAIAVIDKQFSIHNKAMIVETENEELEVRQRNDNGDCAYLYIVMQLCAEKTLEDWIRKNKTPESRKLVEMKHWIKQLARGLDYLHQKGYIHRDLKPGNVFFSLESRKDHQILKIGDLGLATKADGALRSHCQDSDSSAKHTMNVGTRSYMSPEQIGRKLYTEKVDIFALGLVATELIIPFSTASERIHTFGSFQKGEIPAILDSCPESRDFLLQLTSLNPADRPSANDVAAHPFLQ